MDNVASLVHTRTLLGFCVGFCPSHYREYPNYYYSGPSHCTQTPLADNNNFDEFIRQRKPSGFLNNKM